MAKSRNPTLRHPIVKALPLLHFLAPSSRSVAQTAAALSRFKHRKSLQRRWWQCEFTTAQAGPLVPQKMNGQHCDLVVALDLA